MTRMFKKSDGDHEILCRTCLRADEEAAAAELRPALFPGTYQRLVCQRCHRPALLEADHRSARHVPARALVPARRQTELALPHHLPHF